MRRLVNASRESKITFLILITALIARLAVVFYDGDQSMPYEWGILVPNMLAGRGFSYFSLDQDNTIKEEYLSNPGAVYPSAYMPPAYPVFLASVSSVVRNERSAVLLVEVIQALMGATICLLVYYTTKHLFDEWSAFIALLISSFYPILVFSSSQISVVSVGGLLVQFAVLILSLFTDERYENNQKQLSILGGITLGVLVLARAETLLFALMIMGWLFWHLRKKWQNVFLLSIVTVMVISPQVSRNWYVFGQFTPSTTTFGSNLWHGQNENATGTYSGYVVPPVTGSAGLTQKIEDIKPTNTYELDRDKLCQEDALAFIKSHPEKLITLALRKFAYYWGGIYFGFEMNYPGAHSPLILVPWFFLLPFFIIGLIQAFKQYHNLMILYLLLISSTLVSMVFYVIPRYPIFVLPAVIIFGSYGIFFLWNLYQSMVE